jgi:hypothetical protein
MDILRKAQVYSSVCNRDYEGEIRTAGDTVKINGIGDVTVSTYTKNSTTISFQTLEDSSQSLSIDQSKYFAFEIDDVDKAQQTPKIMDQAMSRAAYHMRDSQDSFIAGLHAGAGVTSGLGTDVTALTVTAAASTGGNTGVFNLFSLIAKGLDGANCPLEGRWIIVPPWLHQKIVLAQATNYNVSGEPVSNGFIGKMWGFNVYMSNNVKNTGSAFYKVLAGTNQAITMAEQIVSVEALRRESSFRDAVKGLMLYGAKVVQSGALACATLTEGTN